LARNSDGHRSRFDSTGYPQCRHLRSHYPKSSRILHGPTVSEEECTLTCSFLRSLTYMDKMSTLSSHWLARRYAFDFSWSSMHQRAKRMASSRKAVSARKSQFEDEKLYFKGNQTRTLYCYRVPTESSRRQLVSMSSICWNKGPMMFRSCRA